MLRCENTAKLVEVLFGAETLADKKYCYLDRGSRSHYTAREGVLGNSAD